MPANCGTGVRAANSFKTRFVAPATMTCSSGSCEVSCSRRSLESASFSASSSGASSHRSTSGRRWPTDRGPTRCAPLLIFHGFRFVGLAFLVPGVVSPEVPAAFAAPAAYGDLITATLGLTALSLLPSTAGLAVAWAFNIVGSLDLIYAFVQGNRTGIGFAPGLQGAAYFIPTVLVPLLLITHGLMFRLLLRRDSGGHAARPHTID
jgi:hypothetical protein